MARSGIRFVGLQGAIKGLKDATGKINTKAFNGMEDGGQSVKADSQAMVPYEFGDLFNSVVTEGDEKRGEVQIAYEDRKAFFVHENLTARHAPGKQAQFLKKALDRNAKAILENMLRKAHV